MLFNYFLPRENEVIFSKVDYLSLTFHKLIRYISLNHMIIEQKNLFDNLHQVTTNNKSKGKLEHIRVRSIFYLHTYFLSVWKKRLLIPNN